MLPTDCLHTADIARTARLRWLLLRVEQLDALYDRAIAKGCRFEAHAAGTTGSTGEPGVSGELKRLCS